MKTYPIAALDLETTGIDADCRIVEYAVVSAKAVSEKGDYIVGRVNPQIPISTGASAAHNIRDEDVAQLKPLDKRMCDWMSEIINEHIVLIHNAWYDWPIIEREFARVGAEVPRPIIVLDTLEFSKRLNMGKVEKHTLAYLYHHYKLPERPGFHGAEADCRSTLEVFHAMLRQCGESWAAQFPNFEHDALDALTSRIYSGSSHDTMPFGKWKGKPFTEIDVGYLRWGLDVADFRDVWLKVSFAQELHRRFPGNAAIRNTLAVLTEQAQLYPFPTTIRRD